MFTTLSLFCCAISRNVVKVKGRSSIPPGLLPAFSHPIRTTTLNAMINKIIVNNLFFMIAPYLFWILSQTRFFQGLKHIKIYECSSKPQKITDKSLKRYRFPGRKEGIVIDKAIRHNRPKSRKECRFLFQSEKW